MAVRALAVTLLAAAAVVAALLATGALLATAAPAKDYEPSCRGSTALGDRPHELAFRVSCNFEMRSVDVQPADPAIVRAVRKHPRLVNPDPEDHFRCWRHGNAARCAGRAGSHVKLIGALRMHGHRCGTPTDIHIFGGMDCDEPGQGCPSIGYLGHVRDPKPSGCG